MIKKLSDIISESKKYLSNDVSLKDIKYLIKETFSLTDSDYLLKSDELFDDVKIIEKLEKLKEGMPVEYALGYAYFLGNKFLLNKDTLIPRNETEELVLKTIEYIKKYNFNDPEILDIGSGSGCIAISISKRLPSKKVSGVEIAPAAFEMCLKNNMLNNTNVNFILSDIEKNIDKNYKCDVIISNPPYISCDSFVQESVKKYEPPLALYADNKGLAIYERIFKEMRPYLNIRALLAFEISPEQKEELILLKDKYLPEFTIFFEEDMNKLTRFMFLVR